MLELQLKCFTAVTENERVRDTVCQVSNISYHGELLGCFSGRPSRIINTSDITE